VAQKDRQQKERKGKPDEHEHVFARPARAIEELLCFAQYLAVLLGVEYLPMFG
jgi:hypothetical protein